MQRILVIRIGRLGDSVMATAVIDPLREVFGEDTVIDFLTGGGASARVLELDRRIERVHALQHGRLPLWLNPGKRRLRAYSRSLPYDVVINLERSAKYDDLARVISHRRYCGRPLTPPEDAPGRHAVDMEKSVYRALLGEERVRRAEPRLDVSGSAAGGSALNADSAVAAAKNRVILNPGFSGIGRKDYRSHRGWPVEHWSELVWLLQDRGLEVSVNSLPPEVAELEALHQLPGVRSLLGADLPQLVAAIRGAACVISVDTGTMHLAAALGTPVVALFGPSLPERTAPYSRSTPVALLASGVDCQPCYGTPLQKSCGFNQCMYELTPSVVFSACRKLMTTPRVPDQDQSGP